MAAGFLAQPQIKPQPKDNLQPALECGQNHIEPLHAKILWRCDLPCLLRGMSHQQPRTAWVLRTLRSVRGRENLDGNCEIRRGVR